MHDEDALAPWQAARPADFHVPEGIVYLDTAAHGPRLRAVHRAALASLDAGIAPWRQSDDAWEAAIERVRTLAAGCFDDDPDAVALVPSAAYGIATAARNLPLARGDAVLVTASAFPSQVLAWQVRCAAVGARLAVARPAPGESDTDAVLRMLATDPAIRVLSLAHVGWIDGSVLDLDRIADEARARGAALVLDLSQSLGAMPARIARWQPAFAVSVGYKWLLGPGALAYLWVAPAWRERGEAIEQHWRARDPVAVWRDDPGVAPAYRAGARRYDAGEVPTPLRLAMADAALSQVHAWRIERIAAGLQARTRALADAVRDVGLDRWLPGTVASHILGLRPPPARLSAIEDALREAHVIATVRRGCVRLAPHLHLGVDAFAPVADVLVRAARVP